MALLLAALLFQPDEIDDLIRALGHEDWQVREEAHERLLRAGRRALERLEALRSHDPEIRWRAGEILKFLRRLRHSKAVLAVVLIDASGRCRAALQFEGLDDSGYRGPVRIGDVETRVSVPFDAVVRLGTFAGRSAYAVARRDAEWIEGAPAESLRLFLGPLERGVDVDMDAEVPPAFHLLIEASGFEPLVGPLARRAASSRDPFVRGLCARAIARQTGAAIPKDLTAWFEEMSK
jgi:hypothetical protein